MSFSEEEYIATQARDRQKVVDMLTNAGVRIKISACGCCNSPWITYKDSDDDVVQIEGVKVDTMGD